MKILKKINKGLILTIIVLVILTVYLINAEMKRNAAKPEIEKAVKEYIQLMNKYAVLPEDMQKLQADIITEEGKTNKDIDDKIEEHLKKLEQELKQKMIDNKTIIDMQKEQMEDFLRSENDFSQKVLIKYNREPIKIKKYVFDDEQVTVKINSKIDFEIKYLSNEGEKIKKDNFNIDEESITLKLEGEKWKVIYADCSYYIEGNSINTIMPY